VHPIERLRAVARARDVDQTLLASEAATALGSLAFDPMGLLTSCRRLIDRHPGAGALWWSCARLVAADDARAEAQAITRDLEDDPARIDLCLELPEGGAVGVVSDAAGGSDLAYELAGTRDDLDVIDGDDPADLRWDRATPDDGRPVAPILVIETGAAGPDRFLAAPGTEDAICRARDADGAVWLVVGVGRRLPAPMFDAVAARAPRGELVSTDQVDRVIEPRSMPCPCPPELLRPPAGA
jgi:hypothetical protein